MVLENVEKEYMYLKIASVMWSSPLSDYNKVLATNLRSQWWHTSCGLRSGLLLNCKEFIARPERSWSRIERNTNVAPLCCSIYPEMQGYEEWSQLKQNLDKITKIKAAVHLYANPEFEGKAACKGSKAISYERRAKICWGARNEAGPTTPRTNWPHKRRWGGGKVEDRRMGQESSAEQARWRDGGGETAGKADGQPMEWKGPGQRLLCLDVGMENWPNTHSGRNPWTEPTTLTS